MYCCSDHHNIYYQVIGQGQDLIMLHGWGQDVSTFWNITDLLSDTFRIWLIDLPGFGRSQLVDYNMRVLDYANIVRDFISCQKINHPIILGHSFGGRVAIKLAARYPNFVSKLIIEDVPTRQIQQPFRKLFLYVTAKAIKYFVPDLANFKTRIRRKFYRKIGSDYSDSGLLRETFLNVVNEDLTDDVRVMSAQTLLLWGERDKAVPLNEGISIYQLARNARIEVLEGVGHFPHLENPKLFSYYVKDFC